MNFYVLEPENGDMFGRKWAYAEIIEPSNSGESDECPVCHKTVSQLRWLPPHRIKLSTSKPEKWGDFVWGAGFPLLISGRFKEIYEKEGLSGIDEISPPVEILKAGVRKLPDLPSRHFEYHLIHVPWGGANQDDAASGVSYQNPENIRCSYCRKGVAYRKQVRIVIEDSSWNGSDIFKPRNTPAQFVVSERFKEMAEKYQLNNLWLIPIEKYAYDERRPLSEGLSWYVNE